MNWVKSKLALEGKELLLFSTSWAFGAWLLIVGGLKWINGPANFVGYITKSFQETLLPEPLVLVTAWVILAAEVIIGGWLMTEYCKKWAWIAAGKLMFILMLGKTFTGDYATVANNWQYLLLCIVMASLCSKQND